MKRPHHVLQGRDYALEKYKSSHAGFSLPKQGAQVTVPDTVSPA